MSKDEFRCAIEEMTKILISTTEWIDTEYLFSGRITEQEFFAQIVFEYYKWVRINQAERKSLRKHYDVRTEYGMASYRNATYNHDRIVQRYEENLERLGLPKTEESERKTERVANQDGVFEYMLIDKYDCATTEKCAAQTSGRPVVSAFERGSIRHSNTYSNDRVNEIFKKYYEELRAISNEGDCEKWLDRVIDIYHMEYCMPVSYVYQLADYMKRNSKKQIDKERCWMLYGILNIATEEGTLVRVRNNFIYCRHKWFDMLFEDDAKYQSDFWHMVYVSHVENYLLSKLKEDDHMECVAKKIRIEDMVNYFKTYYDLTELISFPDDGEINSTVIMYIRRLVRYIFEQRETKEEAEG